MKKLSNYNFFKDKIEDNIEKRIVISTTCIYLPEKNGLVGKKITLLWSDGYVQSWTEWRKAY